MIISAVTATPTAAEIERYMPLVRQVVAKVLRRVPPSVVRDDLMSAGVCGLVDCLRRHTGADEAFEAYARIRIRGAVIDELRKLDFVSRHHRAHVDSPKVVWLEDLSEDGDPVELPDYAAVDASQLLEGQADLRTLSEAIAALPPREQQIIRMRYFESKTVHEIGSELSLSDPRISQLHARALTRLRQFMVA